MADGHGEGDHRDDEEGGEDLERAFHCFGCLVGGWTRLLARILRGYDRFAPATCGAWRLICLLGVRWRTQFLTLCL